MSYNVLETCFLFPGIKSSDCAAWVQALGSILAIAAAVVIAHRDSRRRHQERIDDRIDQELGRFGAPIALIDAFIDDMAFAVNGMFRFQESWEGGASWAYDVIRRIRQDIQDIRPSTLSTVNAVRAARAAQTEIEYALVELEELATMASTLLEPTFDRLTAFHERLARIRGHADTLRAELVKVTAPHNS